MVSPCARSKQRTSNETKRAPHHRFAAQSRDETEDDVSEHHAENKHRAEEQRFALITSFGHVGERYRDRSQSHRIEAERKAGKESDARRCEARMFYRRAQRLCLHHPRPRFRSINDLRSCTTVGIEVKTTSPSMTIEGSVMTPSSTARSTLSRTFISHHSTPFIAACAAVRSSACRSPHAKQPGL